MVRPAAASSPAAQAGRASGQWRKQGQGLAIGPKGPLARGKRAGGQTIRASKGQGQNTANAGKPCGHEKALAGKARAKGCGQGFGFI